MHWFVLILGGLFEVGFTFCLKKSENFTHLGWALGFVFCAGMSFYLLNYSLSHIPLGTAYVVWTGIGAVGTAILGILFFKESADFWRIFFILLLISAIIGLKVVSAKIK